MHKSTAIKIDQMRQASKFRSRRGLAYQKLRTLASEA